MDTIYNRVRLVFKEHKTEMLIAVAIGIVLGGIFI